MANSFLIQQPLLALSIFRFGKICFLFNLPNKSCYLYQETEVKKQLHILVRIMDSSCWSSGRSKKQNLTSTVLIDISLFMFGNCAAVSSMLWFPYLGNSSLAMSFIAVTFPFFPSFFQVPVPGPNVMRLTPAQRKRMSGKLPALHVSR